MLFPLANFKCDTKTFWELTKYSEPPLEADIEQTVLKPYVIEQTVFVMTSDIRGLNIPC